MNEENCLSCVYYTKLYNPNDLLDPNKNFEKFGVCELDDVVVYQGYLCSDFENINLEDL